MDPGRPASVSSSMTPSSLCLEVQNAKIYAEYVSRHYAFAFRTLAHFLPWFWRLTSINCWQPALRHSACVSHINTDPPLQTPPLPPLPSSGICFASFPPVLPGCCCCWRWSSVSPQTRTSISVPGMQTQACAGEFCNVGWHFWLQGTVHTLHKLTLGTGACHQILLRSTCQCNSHMLRCYCQRMSQLLPMDSLASLWVMLCILVM